MSGEPVFSRRLLIGWIAAATVVFVVSLYFLGGGEVGVGGVGPGSYSRSAVGYAGLAEVLQQLGIPVVKSRSNSLDKLSPGSVLVIAEPQAAAQSETTVRALLKADTVLLVLPKWIGRPDPDRPGWLIDAALQPLLLAQRLLDLVAPKGQALREDKPVAWTTNTLRLAPRIDQPIQLIRGGQLRPVIAGDSGMLVGEISDRARKVWVLADPDIIADHGLAHDGNAALAVAIIEALRRGDGSVVFDETIHGSVVQPVSPLRLLFRFPFVVATAQGLIAIALLLWATLRRFGAPQSAPPPLSSGREGLLHNSAMLIEFTGHHGVIVRRYIEETIRDVARQLHAPSRLSGPELVGWLQQVGLARGIKVDCGAVRRQAMQPGLDRHRDQPMLVRLAREIHQWKEAITDGRARDPRRH